MAAFSDHMDALDNFPGFPENDEDSSISNSKKRKINDLKTSTTSSNTMPTPSPPSEPNNIEQNPSNDPISLVIVREDKKQIPFNFINVALKNWDALKCANPDSFVRNNKGTLIKGTITPNKVQTFNRSNKFFTLKDIKYEVYSPKQYTPHLAELYLDLGDLEDKSVLTLSNEDLLEILKTPGDPESNSIISVERIYPRKPISLNARNAVTSCRISIEFSTHVPNRVYFQNVSVPISPYILPPKRCFTCQRLGHASISCKRKVVCPNCAGNHSSDRCTTKDQEKFRCAACNSNHKATSQGCEFYKKSSQNS